MYTVTLYSLNSVSSLYNPCVSVHDSDLMTSLQRVMKGKFEYVVEYKIAIVRRFQIEELAKCMRVVVITL